MDRNDEKTVRKTKGPVRWLCFAGGLVTLALGTVGIVLPVLPTAPFYLLTLFLFARSSERFHRWFVGSKLYERHLKEFAENRTMPMDREILLLSGVTVVLLCAMVRIDVTAMYIIFPAVIALKYAYFLLRVRAVRRGMATRQTRLAALLLGLAMVAAAAVLKSAVLYVAVPVTLAVYAGYFLFAKDPGARRQAEEHV